MQPAADNAFWLGKVTEYGNQKHSGYTILFNYIHHLDGFYAGYFNPSPDVVFWPSEVAAVNVYIVKCYPNGEILPVDMIESYRCSQTADVKAGRLPTASVQCSRFARMLTRLGKFVSTRALHSNLRIGLLFYRSIECEHPSACSLLQNGRRIG